MKVEKIHNDEAMAVLAKLDEAMRMLETIRISYGEFKLLDREIKHILDPRRFM